MMDLDSQILEAQRNAEQAEDQARQIEARIAQIPGAARLLPRRRYGSPLDRQAIASNLTLSALIDRADPGLAMLLGCCSGSYRTAEAERQARLEAADRMAQLTAQLRDRNQAARQQRDADIRRGVVPFSGGRRMGG